MLSVWTKVEDLLNTRTGHNSKMQVVRMRASDGLKIVGKIYKISQPNITYYTLLLLGVVISIYSYMLSLGCDFNSIVFLILKAII